MIVLLFIGISCLLKCLYNLYQCRIGRCVWDVSGIKRNQILDKEVSWAKTRCCLGAGVLYVTSLAHVVFLEGFCL